MTRRRSPRSSAPWPALLLAAAVGASAAMTARRLLNRPGRPDAAPVLVPVRRIGLPTGHRPGDG